VIVWLASFPRSGNTFLRIVLHELYGLPTYSIYDDDDPVAQRVGTDLVGWSASEDKDALDASPDVCFVKTHRARRGDDERPAIVLVRDGRDSLVSYSQLTGRPLADEVARPAKGEGGHGHWGWMVCSWLEPPAPHRAVLRFEDLVRDPVGTVVPAIGGLLPHLDADLTARIPTFAELHARDAGFFRRGVAGSHRDELPADVEAAFWSRPENARAMRLLGYSRSSGSAS
jgi:hypothetical protein